MAASIASCAQHWKDMAAPNQIIKWVTEGVPVPFESQPPSFDLPNRPLSAVQWDFVNNEIATLLFSGAIERCNYQPVCVSPIFCVPKKGNKLRLILDLRLLNAACTRLGYKNEDIKLAADLVQKDDQMITVDITNGFHHVLIRPQDRDYFGFCWRHVYYRWRVLPFGWTCSPYYFCKILRPLMSYLRTNGLRTMIYVDDILLCAPTRLMSDHKDLLLHCLQDLGFRINF